MSVWFKRIFLSVAVLGLLAAAPAQAQNGPPADPVDLGMADEMMPLAPDGAVPGQYIIVLYDDVTNVRGTASEMGRAHGLGIQFIYTSALKGFAATVPEGRLNALERDPRIAYVEQDQWGGIETHGVNPVVGIQRILADMNTNIDIDGHDDVRIDVDVAVIDTGIDLAHTDLNVVGSTNCTVGSRIRPKCKDGEGDAGHWHGTHVAGTIAALDDGVDVTLNGGTDIVGVAPGARLWAVRVLDSQGRGTAAQYIAGVDWVINNGTIEVANSSLGYPDSPAICLAVQNLADAGVAHAVSAGNESTLVFKSPGNCGDSVITVSAMADYDGLPGGLALVPNCSHGDGDADDSLADFSNYGTDDVDVTAPGVCVASTYPGNAYVWASGTSMSSPHVAGAAALLAASGVSDPAVVKSTLKSKGNTNWDVEGIYYEPLINVSDPNVFAPAMLAVGEEPAPTNASPSAQFSYSCTDLTCSFTDQSSDSDGTVVSWAWDFGDGTTSTVQNPSNGFPAYDVEYTVTLTVTDDDGATGQTSQKITLTEAAVGGGITLSASGHKVKGTQHAHLTWSGGSSSTSVEVTRDLGFIGNGVTAANGTGDYHDDINKKGGGSYVYQVCETDTGACSNEATVTF